MAYTTRLLPQEDWSRLATTAFADTWHLLPADQVLVVVVEDEAQEIVACWAVLSVVHLEGLWVREDHRGRGRVPQLLLGKVQEVLTACDLKDVVTLSQDPKISVLLEHYGGVAVPGTLYVVPAHPLVPA